MFHALVNANGSIGSMQPIPESQKRTDVVLGQQQTIVEITLETDILEYPQGKLNVRGLEFSYEWMTHKESGALRIYFHHRGQLVLANLILPGLARDREASFIRTFDKLIIANCH